MVRYTTIVLAIALADGVRLVKRRGDRGDSSEFIAGSKAWSSNLDEQAEAAEEASTSNDALAATLSTGTLENRINKTLDELDTEWKDAKKAGTDLLNSIAEIDWKGNIGDQMLGIARNSALTGVKWIATTIHPLLGVVFSLMSSLFGWGGAKESKMRKQILTEVEGMIKDALNSLRGDLAAFEVKGVMDTINTADENHTLWEKLPLTLASSFSKVFMQCWGSPGHPDCRTWRQFGGGGCALMQEIKFTELMIMVGAQMLDYEIENPVFADNVEKASNRTLAHYNVFQGARLSFAHPDHGVEKGSVACGGRMKNRTCTTYPSRDKFLNEDFCSRDRVSCGSQTSTSCRDRTQSYLDSCHSEYVSSIRNNVQNKIKPEVDAVRRAAISFHEGGR